MTKRVDLRLIRGGDQLRHALLALRRPPIHVERAHRGRCGICPARGRGGGGRGLRFGGGADDEGESEEVCGA